MTPAEAAARLAKQLVAERISYALGGALAFTAWGVQVPAQDIELYVFAGEDELVRVLDAFDEAGAMIERPTARRDLARTGRFSTGFHGIAVIVTMAYHPVHDDMERRRVPLTVGEEKPRWFLSPEDLVLTRLVAGDAADLERLFAAQKMDAGYLRDWLQRILPPADPRHAQLASLFGAPAP
jgi:hypothetical protein